MLLAAGILAFGIILAAVISRTPPRKAWANVTVAGTTEQNEHFQGSVTLYDDESEDSQLAKVWKLFEMREKRMKEQNMRMIEMMAEGRAVAQKAAEDKKALEAGEGATVTAINQKKV